MSSWEETQSPHFSARHDEADVEDVVGVLELLEGTRQRLEPLFPALPEMVSVVLHGTRAQLYTAQPVLTAIVRLTAPAARRYVVGWPTTETLHLLGPRHVDTRASNVPGSRELVLLAPAALYAQLVVGFNNPDLPPPFRPGATRHMLAWAWLWAGAGQYLGGQTIHAQGQEVGFTNDGVQAASDDAEPDAASET